MAAWVLDIFSNFNLVKNHKITKNSAATDDSEKICIDLESLKIKIVRAELNLKNNGTACIRQHCRKTTVLSSRRCLVNIGVEKMSI